MFQNKFNKYLKNCKCSAKTLASMTGISEATISRYRTGKSVPAVDGGNIESIAEALSELCGGVFAKEEIFEDLFVAAYEELDMVDHRTFAKKLSELIHTLGISMSAMADVIHISVSQLSKICRGQSKARNSVYIAEGVAEYVVSHYSDTDHKTIVLKLIRNDNNKTVGFASSREYYSSIRKWLLEGETQESLLIDDLLHKYAGFNKSNYLSYSKALEQNFEYRKTMDNNQMFTGLNGMEEAVITWLEKSANARVNDEIFMFDEISSPLCRHDDLSAYRWISVVEKLIKSGKRLTVAHNLENDLYQQAREMLIVLPVTMSERIQHYFINEEINEFFRNLLLVSSDAMLVGSANKDNLENSYFGYTEDATAISAARERAKLIVESAQQSHVYLDNRKELVEEIKSVLSHLKEGDSVILYLSSLPLATMEESLLRKVLERNHMSQSEIESAIELYYREREMTYAFMKLCSNYSMDICIDYIKPDRWIANQVRVDSYITVPGLSFFCNQEEYEQHVASTMAYALQCENIRLNIESMKFFKNMDIIIVPGEYAATMTKDDGSVNTSSFKKPIVDAIEELLFVINPRNAKIVQEDERRRDLLQFYKGMTE